MQRHPGQPVAEFPQNAKAPVNRAFSAYLGYCLDIMTTVSSCVSKFQPSIKTLSLIQMPAFEFSDRAVEAALINKITAKTRKDTPVNKLEPETEPKELPQPEPAPKHGRSVDELMERLHLLNN